MASQNVDMRVQDNKLVITIDLSRTFGFSASGKSEIIASTGGNVLVPGRDNVKIGLNVYSPAAR